MDIVVCFPVSGDLGGNGEHSTHTKHDRGNLEEEATTTPSTQKQHGYSAPPWPPSAMTTMTCIN